MAKVADVSCPFVSVIIPVFISQYVDQAIDSVLAQTYKNHEILVVNDGSPETEDLERRLKPYMSRIVYLKQPDEGPSSARNHALRVARGEYAAFLDHDDLWLPGYLEAQIKAFQDNPALDAVYCDTELFGDTHRSGRTYMQLHPSSGEASLEALISARCTVCTTCLVARRQVLLDVGLFDETIRMCEDYDLWLRLLQAGKKFDYHGGVLARRRVHARSATLDGVKTTRHTVAILDKFESLGPHPPEVQAAIGKRRRYLNAVLALAEGKEHLKEARYSEALESFRRADSVLDHWKLKAVMAAMTVSPVIVRRLYRRAA